jgi:hypothetical protein
MTLPYSKQRPVGGQREREAGVGLGHCKISTEKLRVRIKVEKKLKRR